MVGFIVTAAVGLILLLVFLIFDGIFDAINVDFSGSGIFSGVALGGLITGIGCGGIIGTSAGWSFFFSLLLGFAVGIALAAVAIALYRVLKRAEPPEETISPDRLVGTNGVVTAGSDSNGHGLVRVTYLGSPRTMSFVSQAALATGDSVTITEVLGTDVVTVVPSQPTFGRNFE